MKNTDSRDKRWQDLAGLTEAKGVETFGGKYYITWKDPQGKQQRSPGTMSKSEAESVVKSAKKSGWKGMKIVQSTTDEAYFGEASGYDGPSH